MYKGINNSSANPSTNITASEKNSSEVLNFICFLRNAISLLRSFSFYLLTTTSLFKFIAQASNELSSVM